MEKEKNLEQKLFFTFVRKKELNKKLIEGFKIFGNNINKVYVFKVDCFFREFKDFKVEKPKNFDKVILAFSVNKEKDKRFDIKNYSVIHRKSTWNFLFTINALNRILENYTKDKQNLKSVLLNDDGSVKLHLNNSLAITKFDKKMNSDGLVVYRISETILG